MFRVIAFIFLSSSLAFSSFAQGSAIPNFKKSESYKTVRTKLIKAGWKPYNSPEAGPCAEGDERCQGRPEMESCAGTGLGNCKFVWKKASRKLAIFTVGEVPVYSGHKLQ